MRKKKVTSSEFEAFDINTANEITKCGVKFLQDMFSILGYDEQQAKQTIAEFNYVLVPENYKSDTLTQDQIKELQSSLISNFISNLTKLTIVSKDTDSANV